MAFYFSRVELHGAKPGDEAYTLLHEAMTKIGFRREFQSDRKKLPDGSYLGSTNPNDYPASQVKDIILQAVSESGKEGTVVVIRFNSIQDISFSHLEDI